MTFPSNPNDNDIHTAFGRRLKYKSSTSTWEVVSSPSVAIETESPVANTAVSSSSDLPLTGNEIGAMSYSQDTNTLYVWNGTGWFKIALVNTNPTITDGGQATYELNSDGTPTVITLVANDPEGLPLTWSYAVSSGALEDTTISNTGAVFTITPGATAATFNLSFTASDGVNIDTSVSSFTLSFIDWSTATSLHTLHNPLINDPPPPSGYAGQWDEFGYSVAIDGNYAVVGGNAPNNRAFIFDVTTGSLLHTLNDGNALLTYGFGESAAISGNYVAIGSPQVPFEGLMRGQVHILNVTTGAVVHTIDPPLPNPYAGWSSERKLAKFGTDVAMKGNYLIVGAPELNDYYGIAYVYNVTTGALVHTLLNPDYAYAYFGESVAISDNYCIVGAREARTWAGGTTVGKAHIFDLSTGTLLHTLINPNVNAVRSEDYFGDSVAITDTYTVVGATFERKGSTDYSGVVYVYNTVTGSLARTILNPTSEGAFFGQKVAIYEDHLLIGATGQTTSQNNYLGVVYIFDVTTGTLIRTLDNPNHFVGTNIYDGFGSSVGISGKYAIVGAPREDTSNSTSGEDVGKAYIFQAG
jgi:hypothetical protein